MFEREIENIYDIESHNSIICIHGNKVHEIAEWNLLHDTINTPKRTKTFNSHYSPIIHGCTNTQNGRDMFNEFRLLLDSIYSSMTIMVRLIENLLLKENL